MTYHITNAAVTIQCLSPDGTPEDLADAMKAMEKRVTFAVMDACLDIVRCTRATLGHDAGNLDAEMATCLAIMREIQKKAGTGLQMRWRMPMLTQQWMYEQFQAWATNRTGADYLVRMDRHMATLMERVTESA